MTTEAEEGRVYTVTGQDWDADRRGGRRGE